MNKVDFLCYVKANNCNPNGDMDEGNRPKQDLDTGLGIMTDVCIKRRIRDAVNIMKEGEEGYDIYIKNDHIALETKVASVMEEFDIEKLMKMEATDRDAAIKDSLCSRYFDIRTFGAAVTYLANKRYCDGQLNGAVQISFAESLCPINPVRLTLTRVDVSTEADLKKKDREVGAKWIVPYGVYKFEGHISANVAEKNGFTEDDLELLIQAILKMYDFGYSASKTGMEVSKLIVFRHGSKYGDCSFRTLREAVHEEPVEDTPGRKDVKVTIDKAAIPESVEVIEY